MFSTAEGLLTQDNKVTADGLQEVFATNVFGHFILVTCPRAKTWRRGPQAGWAPHGRLCEAR